MEDGQLSKMKIGALIQARMKSTRLPGKILLPLPFDSAEKMLSWPVAELKKSTTIHSIVLATSTNLENECLSQFAADNEIAFFSGSEEDVLNRFVEASKKYQLDHIVRITGDNPFIDIELIDFLVNKHLAERNDYTYSIGLPIGMNIEIVASKALNEVSKRNDLIPPDKEHVTYFFKRTNNEHKVLQHDFELKKIEHLRLTVDFPEDYALVNCLVKFMNNLFLNP